MALRARAKFGRPSAAAPVVRSRRHQRRTRRLSTQRRPARARPTGSFGAGARRRRIAGRSRTRCNGNEPMIRARLALLLFVVLATPAARDLLERVMVAHMLVQIPLLAVVGALGVAALPESTKARLAEWNRSGVAGTLLAIIASSWWMVPRALDWTLASPVMEAVKFTTLPPFVGAPLALSWRPLGSMGRGFVIANVLPMWAVVGWAYIAAPVR